MLKKNDIGLNPTHSDADPRMHDETMKLEELTISENLSTPYLCSLPEAEKLLYPITSEKKSEKVDWDENSAVSMSGDSDTHTQDDEFDFPFPVLYRGRNNVFGSLTLLAKPKKKKADYDSDDTCDDYVECGEMGLCKCQKMRGREYYEYYERIKEDYCTLYPQGRCILPRGTILHFTGASDNMKREDVIDALAALGAKVEFLDYQSGSKEGWARLSSPYEARIIIKKMKDKKLNILGADLSFRVLSGKDEKRYHKKAIEGIYRLQEKSKGLNKKLKKAGYKYVKKIIWT